MSHTRGLLKGSKFNGRQLDRDPSAIAAVEAARDCSHVSKIALGVIISIERAEHLKFTPVSGGLKMQVEGTISLTCEQSRAASTAAIALGITVECRPLNLDPFEAGPWCGSCVLMSCGSCDVAHAQILALRAHSPAALGQFAQDTTATGCPADEY